jgi:hypothetical protein
VRPTAYACVWLQVLTGMLCLASTACSAQIDVEDVRFLRGRWVTPPGELAEATEADYLSLGDEFIVLVDVRNSGPAALTVFNLCTVQSSPQECVEQLVSDDECLGIYPIQLGPGESTTVKSSLPCAAAFRATKAGTITMTIGISTTGGPAERAFETEIAGSEQDIDPPGPGRLCPAVALALVGLAVLGLALSRSSLLR